MKIGILTFHWACNYGAVLQSFALSKACKKLGAEPYLIDYYPRKYKKNIITACNPRHLRLVSKRIKELDKEKKIEAFRKEYLNRTKYYPTSRKLKDICSYYDCFICGSDQIWNMSFIEHSEQTKNNYVYYLDFAPDNKIIASYAPSFGTEQCKESLKENIKSRLQRFDFLSVREETGKRLIKDLGVEKCRVVPDPTILLEKEDYLKLIENEKSNPDVFVYMLHRKMGDAKRLTGILEESGHKITVSENESIEKWLSFIKNSNVVITNSFHGTVFSILFEKPFVSVLIKNSGMNDRIKTLLTHLGLEDRIYNGNTKIIDKEIDWKNVKIKLEKYRKEGYDYLSEIVDFKK